MTREALLLLVLLCLMNHQDVPAYPSAIVGRLVEGGRAGRRRSRSVSLLSRLLVLVVRVMLMDVISARRPSAVQAGRAGRTVPARAAGAAGQHGRCGRTGAAATAAAAAADRALQADADRAAAARRTLSAGTLSQIDTLILHRQLVTVGSEAVGADDAHRRRQRRLIHGE